MRAVGRTEVKTHSTVPFDMDADVAALDARRGMTRALKQGMMQELLTGRIRLV
jgi:type I restriction enzyme S subunit